MGATVMHWCEGKMRIPASDVQRILRQRNKTTSRPLTAYRCSICGDWHIGQRSGKVSRETYGKKIKRKANKGEAK